MARFLSTIASLSLASGVLSSPLDTRQYDTGSGSPCAQGTSHDANVEARVLIKLSERISSCAVCRDTNRVC